jgi:MFS family permease
MTSGQSNSERAISGRAEAGHPDIDGGFAWVRLAAGLALGTIGGVGMWSFAVALPSVQAEFGVSRGEASIPYAAIMLGFGFGGIIMGRLSDRVGIFLPVLIGAIMLGIGYSLAGLAQSLLQFTLPQGLLIGLLGSATVFGPLMADISRWFVKRRGLAIGICASGNYLAGTFWPPVVQHFIETSGWRATHIGIGLFCVAAMLPLSLLMRRSAPPPPAPVFSADGIAMPEIEPKALSPGVMMALLSIAGFACCMAMAMPQVHLVAYCGDLGYGPARGAQMLSLMMAMGVISRLVSGWICDRIGGLATLLAGSVLQGLALLLYLPFDGLASLFLISAMFGLFQGGIVPSYTIIVREYFPAREAGYRIGFVLFATLVGMAVGGWSSGKIYDLTNSYQAAFVHGIAWNLVNGAIVIWLMWRLGRPRREAARAQVLAEQPRAVTT